MKVVTETPLRAAVYTTPAEATRAVESLLAAGFPRDRITVVCSEETKTRYLHEFEHQRPAGTHTPASAAAGSAMGALLGGSLAVAGALTGGLAFVLAGGVAIWSGAVIGGLVGAMMTRGVEHELANFYDQEVAAGKILVAADTQGETELMAAARQVFDGAETATLPLREG